MAAECVADERLMPFTIHISDSELDNSTLEEDAQLAKVQYRSSIRTDPVSFSLFPTDVFCSESVSVCLRICLFCTCVYICVCA
jgi:hypothetical protein